MLPELDDDYNWPYVFAYADGTESKPTAFIPGVLTVDCSPFTIEDVVEVIAKADGENDGANWVIVVKLKDGRYGAIRAGCDYTGWG